MKTALIRWLKPRSGQALVEYALILALVAVVVIAVLTTVGSNISGLLNNIASSVK
jgi:pilus assembly protein Flp/PilA